MKLLIHGRNLDVTQAIRDYTEAKLSRAINHFEGLVKEADVHLSVARNPRVPQQTAEVTVFANGVVIRAQERSENLYASIDLVAGKLSRQLQRYKERITDHHGEPHGTGHNGTGHLDEELVADASSEATPEAAMAPTDLIGDREPALPAPGVRRKYFAMPEMSLEEALDQLELIDHDFYVFRDRKKGDIQVVYHRNHGGYGVIQSRES
ncbi:ribosome-associated translation inhibitor RaiA [Synechococcus sp. Tobar12-5m-g]|uniref:ribosome hibernation-promoting factor, HPF/YfiA family n=1 Tax=unclassified Synechococcus TaxID=2626047 RepID=UPI0020CE4DF4|nr:MULTISPECIES: ribosome-associated translation inhibitor RaiA [unclassified Synechococcus]MCP9771235.1 ribosome-associated translation inhibitor RaiA [Synechococcus sp. Tobar12-5m-g]MCP9872175.1 ribosome-associated translation inhibitor RaiA [Synechococcus sp. Cruz CV-v-12]